jgi:hypothetical protein
VENRFSGFGRRDDRVLTVVVGLVLGGPDVAERTKTFVERVRVGAIALAGFVAAPGLLDLVAGSSG